MSKDVYKRFKQHVSRKASDWIQEILAQGKEPILSVLESVPDLGTAQEREKHWIYHFEGKGCALENIVHNDGAIREREEARDLYKRLYDRFSQTVPQEKVELLIRMTLAGYECVGFCAWDDRYETALDLISLLEKRPGYGLTLDAIDVAKLTFNMFGYTWVGGES